MSIKQIKLTLTHTRGTQLVSLLDLWSEQKLVLLKRTQLHHVHQRESHDLKLQQITVGSVRNKADETHYGSNLQKPPHTHTHKVSVMSCLNQDLMLN